MSDHARLDGEAASEFDARSHRKSVATILPMTPDGLGGLVTPSTQP